MPKPENKKEEEPTPSSVPPAPVTDGVAIDDGSGSLEQIGNYDPLTMPKDALLLISCPRRHGKTTILTDFMRKWKGAERFTHVLVYSKTLSGYEEYVPANHQFDSLQNLKQVVNKQMDVAQYNSKRKKKEDMVKSSVLVVLDDVASETSELRSGETGHVLKWLAVAGRHVCRDDPLETNEFSVCILSQGITLMPPTIRNNTDIFICSRISSRDERQKLVLENLCLHSSRDGVRAAYNILDTVTLSRAYRMIIIEKFRAERQSYKDYVWWYDAKIEPGIRMFGDDLDWSVPKKRITL